MRRAILLGALLLCSAAANAEVVTFDGVPFGNSPTPMGTYVEGGVTVTSLDGNFWAFSNPGELHLDPEGFGTSAYDFTYAGGAFDLVSSISSSPKISSAPCWKASTRTATPWPACS